MKDILATLGPASNNPEIIKEMTNSGVSLFRINLSHIEYQDLEKTINHIRKHTDVPLCIDMEGAQIRSRLICGNSIFYSEGNFIRIYFNDVIGDETKISLSPLGIAKHFEVGDILHIDFDLTTMKVVEIHDDFCVARVVRSGKVGSNKAVITFRPIPLPFLSEKDYKSVQLGREMGIKHFAFSFADCSENVRNLRELAGKDSFIISKIESRMGLQNLKSIINASDAILIDRGDLSKEVDIVKVPFFQRRIISISRINDTPVYVATNLLESMIHSRVPTRAELNDVVSTIMMGANGLVLAAETAVGNNPVQSVKLIKHLVLLCQRWTTNTTIDELLEIPDEDY